MNLAYLNLTKLFANDTIMGVSFYTLTGISLLQFMGLVSYKLVSIAKRNKRVMAFFISKRQRERDLRMIWSSLRGGKWNQTVMKKNTYRIMI